MCSTEEGFHYNIPGTSFSEISYEEGWLVLMRMCGLQCVAESVVESVAVCVAVYPAVEEDVY